MGQQALGSNLFGRKQWVGLPSQQPDTQRAGIIDPDSSPEGPGFMGYPTDKGGMPYGRGGTPFDQGGTGISEEPGILPGNGGLNYGSLPAQYQPYAPSYNPYSPDQGGGHPPTDYSPGGVRSVVDSLPGFIKANPYVKAGSLLWKLGGSIGNAIKRQQQGRDANADLGDTGPGAGPGNSYRNFLDRLAPTKYAPGSPEQLGAVQAAQQSQEASRQFAAMHDTNIGGGFHGYDPQDFDPGSGPHPLSSKMGPSGYHPEVAQFAQLVRGPLSRSGADTTPLKFNHAVNQALISRNLRGIPGQAAGPITTHAARTQAK
jgi:hypothetical protein